MKQLVLTFLLTVAMAGCEFNSATPPRPVSDARPSQPFALNVGDVAPETAGLDTEGKQMTLSQYRGKVVLLMFWGHW